VSRYGGPGWRSPCVWFLVAPPPLQPPDRCFPAWPSWTTRQLPGGLHRGVWWSGELPQADALGWTPNSRTCPVFWSPVRATTSPLRLGGPRRVTCPSPLTLYL